MFITYLLFSHYSVYFRCLRKLGNPSGSERVVYYLVVMLFGLIIFSIDFY